MKCQESLPKNFSKLLHLRYLKLGSPRYTEVSLPRTLPRFYHLIFLDLIDWHGSSDLPKSISHLLNLRHFIARRELHSNVPEVGKIEHLEELKEFHVKKESVGFELEELGKLSNLGGELRVCNLDKVATKEEASKAKLASKRKLKILGLVWGTQQSGVDADVIDGLQPHGSLKELRIKDRGGATGPPSWLYFDIPIAHLESLTLKGVSWVTLPPFGQLPCLKRLVLKDIGRVRHMGPDSGTGRNQCFRHLKEVEIANMPVLETWTLEPTCHLFPVLESISCFDCPSLLALPFLPDCSISCTTEIHCPSLHSLRIIDCPELLLPPMPPAPSLSTISIRDRHADSDRMALSIHNLKLVSFSGALAFHNMGNNIVSLECHNGSITSWSDLQKASLSQLFIENDTSIQSLASISKLTSLTCLSLVNCDKLTVDGFNHLNTAVRLKVLVVYNEKDLPRSIAVDLLSEVARRTKQLSAGSFQIWALAVHNMRNIVLSEVADQLQKATSLRDLGIFFFFFLFAGRDLGIFGDSSIQSLTGLSEVARRTKQLPAGSFQLERLEVDCISAVLVSPICSLLAASLNTLTFRYDQRVGSFTEDEEKSLQLLTSLQDLGFVHCPGLLSLPQGLHSLSSLRYLEASDCPQIQSLPKGGLPSSLIDIQAFDCSTNLQYELSSLEATNRKLNVCWDIYSDKCRGSTLRYRPDVLSWYLSTLKQKARE